MSRSDHGNDTPRRSAPIPREGGERARTRAALRHGDWDTIPSTLQTRQIRRQTTI